MHSDDLGKQLGIKLGLFINKKILNIIPTNWWNFQKTKWSIIQLIIFNVFCTLLSRSIRRASSSRRGSRRGSRRDSRRDSRRGSRLPSSRKSGREGTWNRLWLSQLLPFHSYIMYRILHIFSESTLGRRQSYSEFCRHKYIRLVKSLLWRGELGENFCC